MFGPVPPALDAQQPHALLSGRHAVRARHQLDGFARRAHSGFNLGADRHPFHETTEGRDEERVAPVAAVVADLVAEETSRDSDARRILIAGHASLYVL